MDRLALCEQIRVLLPGRLRRFEPLCSRTIMRRAVLDRYLRNTHHNRGDVTRRSGERVMCAMTSSNECYVRTRTCTRTYKRPRKPHTYTHKKYPNFKIHTHTTTATPSLVRSINPGRVYVSPLRLPAAVYRHGARRSMTDIE